MIDLIKDRLGLQHAWGNSERKVIMARPMFSDQTGTVRSFGFR